MPSEDEIEVKEEEQSQRSSSESDGIPREYFVYLLANTLASRTYIGVTNNLKRRLKQHNVKLAGGAKYTKAFKGDGEWFYYCRISNLTKSEALTIEATARRMNTKLTGGKPVENRVKVLVVILQEFPKAEMDLDNATLADLENEDSKENDDSRISGGESEAVKADQSTVKERREQKQARKEEVK